MEIQHREISKLIPYINNTRTHSDEQVQQIASSIKEFGFTNPILLDEKDGIIAGHGRIMAAKLLSLDEIPTITLKGLTESQIKAYIIADNKLALNAGWDEELLKVEIEGLYGEGFDIDLLGFTLEELDEIDIDLDGSLDVLDESKADEVPELEENPVIKLGDLIELGHNYQHRLLCGDSTSEDDVKRLMDGKKADMVFTDPPYNIDFKGTLSSTSKNGKIVTMKQGYSVPNSEYDDIKNDKKTNEDFRIFIDKVIDRIKENTIGGWYICFASSTIHELLTPLVEKDMKWKSLIVWNKNQSPMGGGHFRKKYEPIAYGYFNNLFYGKEYAEDDVWDVARTVKNDLHPTMKPIPLIERAIGYSSNGNAIVLDLFLGSGSTMIASENLTRKCYGMELDEKYAQVIIQRYCDYTSIDTIKINGEEVSWSEYKDNALAEMPSNS